MLQNSDQLAQAEVRLALPEILKAGEQARDSCRVFHPYEPNQRKLRMRKAALPGREERL